LIAQQKLAIRTEQKNVAQLIKLRREWNKYFYFIDEP